MSQHEQPANQREFHHSLPKKRMSAGALLFDGSGSLLIVRPSYKPTWEIPGGAVGEDESPAAACRREIQEEIGLDIAPSRLLCVDYNSSTGSYLESLMFLFAAPVISEQSKRSIRLDSAELIDFRFADPEEATSLLGPRLGPRISTVLATDAGGGAVYLENQAPILG